MYKEFRDVCLTGAIEQMYNDMAGRHRARKASIQIIKTAVLKAKDVKRAPIQQVLSAQIKFPLTHIKPRPAHRRFKKTFSTVRPSTFVG